MSVSHSAKPAVPGGARVVFRREWQGYLDSSIAMVYGSAFIVLAGSLFMNEFFLRSELNMLAYFEILPWLLVLFVPCVSMRMWAEERSQGTLELLLTLPFRPAELVAGKFVAALLFFVTILGGSFPIVILLACLGEPRWGPIVSSYLGAIYLGSCFLSLGACISILTRDQIVAFVGSSFLCALLILSGHPQIVEVLDGLHNSIRIGSLLSEYLSLLPRYENFVDGRIRVADLVYLSGFIVVGLSANTFLLERQR